MFGLIWIDNGNDRTMGLRRMVPAGTYPGHPSFGPLTFLVDDWYGMTEDLRSLGRLPSAPSSCPGNRFLGGA